MKEQTLAVQRMQDYTFRELRKDEIDMENAQSVFVQVLHKPERKVLIKRGVKTEDSFSYCEEVGCEVWGLLTCMDFGCGVKRK